MSDAKHLKPYHFQPGNPGRPKGAVSGRARILQELDRMFKDDRNIERLRRDWQELFEKNPTGFVQRIAAQFIPREMILRHLEAPQPGGGIVMNLLVVRERVTVDADGNEIKRERFKLPERTGGSNGKLVIDAPASSSWQGRDENGKGTSEVQIEDGKVVSELPSDDNGQKMIDQVNSGDDEKEE